MKYKNLIIETTVIILLSFIIGIGYRIILHNENKLQLECQYYLQRATETNNEDNIIKYQPQCSDYLSFLN